MLLTSWQSKIDSQDCLCHQSKSTKEMYGNRQLEANQKHEVLPVTPTLLLTWKPTEIFLHERERELHLVLSPHETTFIGVRKFLNLWIWLLAFELVGTPFGHIKFSGGFAPNFVGYHIRYDLQQVGITAKRGEWLVDWIKAAADAKFVVQARDFREFRGRLGFVAQLLVWLKPHLAPLYGWSSAVAPGTVGKLPETIVLTLLYISFHLKRGSFLLSVKRPVVFSKETFRTGAKCEDEPSAARSPTGRPHRQAETKAGHGINTRHTCAHKQTNGTTSKVRY